MNTPRWERAKDIFDAALDLPMDKRADFLAEACGDDTELRHEVDGLLAADTEAGSFMDPGWLAALSPFVAEPEFQLAAGDVISGRFKIVRPLGDGGMGRVYEAHDTVLGVQVALKTLRPEISANPEVLFRFRQEVRIAHRITHPNVCRTFHLDHELRQNGADESSAIDLTFLTMEYLEGETLQQLLKRSGRLPRERALLIAQQMAEAIEAAHRTGIVHRDIKPGNVMICPATSSDALERIVMTDFGLAKFEAGAVNNDFTSISQPGRAMGTLSYMSPEQLEGKEVSAATDIYAFGLVLYEMVTGVKTFPDSSTMAAAYRRVLEPPPSPRAVVPDLPREWETAILGCLQIEPEARFQSACEAVAILDGTNQYSSRLRALQRSKPIHRPVSHRKAIIWGSGIIAAMALCALGFRYYTAREDSAVAAGTLVYLAPVKNETGEKQLDNVTQLVQAGLEQSAHINLLDAGRVGDILQQMTKPADAVIDAPTAREIAMRAGAARVVFLTVAGSGGDYYLNIEIQQPSSSPTRYLEHWAKRFIWKGVSEKPEMGATIPLELSDSLRQASNWIRHEAGESAYDIARLDLPPEDITTKSWQALTEYTKAEQLITGFQREKAVDLLQNATQIDPGFATAYGRLGDVLDSVGREVEGYDAYRKALRTEAQSRLSRRERDRIRGMFALDTGDEKSAEEAFRDYAEYYEADYSGWFFRAYPLMMMRRVPEAVETLKHAFSVDPQRVSAPDHLVRCYMILGLLEDAWKWQRWLASHGYPYDADHEAALLKLQQGEYADAENSFRAMLQTKEPYDFSIGEALLSRYYAERGAYQKALDTTEKGIKFDKSNGFTSLESAKRIDRIAIRCALRETQDFKFEVHESLYLHPNPDLFMTASDVLDACQTQAHLSNSTLLSIYEDMLKLLPKQDESVISKVALLRLHGEALLLQGKSQSAITEMLKADNLEAPARSKSYLAHAYLIASLQVLDTGSKASLLAKAIGIYHDIATQPAWIWNSFQYLPPGSYCDNLQTYLRLKDAASKARDLDTQYLFDRYATLRGTDATKPSTESTSR